LIGYLLSNRRAYAALDAAREADRALPKNAEIRLALAEVLASTGRTSEAIEVVRPWLAGTPGARVDLARYLIRSGNRDEAVRLLAGGADSSVEVALQQAQLELEALHPELAAKRLQRWFRSGDGGVELPATYGLALLQSGRYPEAAKVLAPAVGAAPQVSALQYYLGSALRLSGDLDRLAEAEQHLSRAAEVASAEPYYQYELALARVQLRDWSGARTAMEEAAVLKPDLPEVQRDLARIYERISPPEMEKAAVCRARYLQLLQDPRGAVAALEPLRAASPDSRLIVPALALAYHDAEQSKRSVALLTDLHQRHPEDRDVLWDLFRAQRAADDYPAALVTLDQISASRPDAPEVLQERADLLQRLQRYPEAEAVLARLQALEPQNAVRSYELGLFQTLWSKQPNRLQMAEANFREALRLQPDYVGPHYRLGLLFESTGRPAEAVEQLQRALELAPELGDALRPLGRAYARLGDRARADECFRAYRRYQEQEEQKRRLRLVSSPSRATRETRKRLYQFLLDTGALPEATRELEAYVHRYPEDLAARTQLARLHGLARRFQLQFEERSAPKSGAHA
jgi:predicted Zn-dependent protease